MADAEPIRDDELGTLFASFLDRTGVLLAVSGGADSTALMHLAARWRERGGVPGRLVVATVDHGLRLEGAAWCAAVEAGAARLGMPCRRLAWQGGSRTTGVQARARAARYRLLAGAASDEGCDAVATGHTQDDQAETVLMRLLHGSGPDGLGGMRPEVQLGRTALLRPLLDVPHARLLATLRQGGIGWIEDPSNADPRFERVRVRDALGRGAVPGLTAGRLAILARRAARAAEALDREAARLGAELIERDGARVRLPARWWHLAHELRLRVLARAVLASGSQAPARLSRLEGLEARLHSAWRAGQVRRGSLGGVVVSLEQDGVLRLDPEPVRRRGRPPVVSE